MKTFCLLLQPKFGASLDILKVEIGGDAQSTGVCRVATTDSESICDWQAPKAVCMLHTPVRTPVFYSC